MASATDSASVAGSVPSRIAHQVAGMLRSSLRRSVSRRGIRSGKQSEASFSEGYMSAEPLWVPVPVPELDAELKDMLSDLDARVAPEVLTNLGVTSCEDLAELCFLQPHMLEDKLGADAFSKLWFTFIGYNGRITVDFPEGIREIPSLRYKGNVLVRGSLKAAHDITVDGWFQVGGDIVLVESMDIGEDAKLAASASLERVSNVRCGGTLIVNYCPRLVAVDDDVVIGEGLAARDCAALTSIPAGLDVTGSLDLKGCVSITTLPSGLRIGGKLVLKECTSLRELPADIEVESSIGLRRCLKLESLPDGFSCRLHLDLHECVALTALPDNLQIGGWANFSKTGIGALPTNLRVGSNLRLDDTEIEEIPADLVFGGYLQARNCRQLRELPDGLHVLGSLELQSCTALARLPRSLVVDDTLNLRGCTALTELPDDIIVRRSVNLELCSSIRTLPRSLLEWNVHPQQVTLRPYATLGSRSLPADEPPHVFYLGGSGVTPDEVSRLRDFSTGNARFEFSRPTAETEYFSTLPEAVRFWFDTANVPLQDRFEVHLGAADERAMLGFLSKLRWSAEFNKSQFQEALAKRVVAALDLLRSDAYARDEVMARISDSVDACADKPIWALNQITLIAKVAHARGDREAIRALGLGVMRLEVVHAHVRSKIASIKVVDDVCVYLRFEVELREDLDLPVAALDMLFPAFIRVSGEELSAARAEALAITDEDFEIWLETWPEWQRQLRSEAAAEVSFAKLTRNSRRFSLSWTDVFGNTGIDDPVRVQRGGPIWSLSDLLRHWVATGLDLYNSPLSIDQVRNLTRCKSLPRRAS